jgi:hypothetical protein
MGVLSTTRFFAALILLPALALAAGKNYDYDKEVEEKPWAEVEAQLPAYPAKEDLIPFTVGAVREVKYFIDAKSLAVGSDGVIRYTLVIVSSAGAQNVSFEGLRCSTAERRIYAFGRADGTWSKARSNQWVRIQGNSNNHNVELYTNYFCSVGATEITSAESAREVLRSSKQVGIGRN